MDPALRQAQGPLNISFIFFTVIQAWCWTGAENLSILRSGKEKMHSETNINSHCHLEDFWLNGHHSRHWIDNSTGYDLGEAYYTPSHKEYLQRIKLRKQLQEKLHPLINTKLTNKGSQIDANFTSRSIGKLGSDKAINKSVLNGFSTQEHFEAACQIKQFYEKSDFIGRFLDDRNDPNVIAMYRFQIPITLTSGKKAFAYISTKEVKIHGNRTYTIELLSNPYQKK